MQYIKNGNFEKRLWRWSNAGSKTPKQKDRIQGHYNQTTKSGDITYRGLSVKYFYIDPHSSNRSAGDALKIQCDAEDFWSYGRIPDSVCGEIVLVKPRHNIKDPVQGCPFKATSRY